MKPLTRVSVVVPTIGRAILADVIRRVVEQHPFELILVADAHQDRVHQAVAASGHRADPRVRVIPGPGRGAALARETGIDVATGDVVLLLDDDIVPEPGLIDGHRAAQDAAPSRVVVGYIPIAPDLAHRSVAAAIYSNDYERECDVLEEHPELVLLALWGGNVSMHRSDCQRVPHTVDNFRARLLEDTEFGVRCALAGLDGIFDRRLRAVHYHDQSVSEFLETSVRQMRDYEYLCTLYPELTQLPDPALGMPRLARAALRATRTRGLGPPLRRASVWAATRLGRGRPNPLRIKAVVFARAAVQLAPG